MRPLLGRNPRPMIAHLQLEPAARLGRQVDFHRRQTVLQGIIDQVVEYALEAAV